MKYHNINIKEDSIFRLFIKIAIPSSIGTIFQNLNSIVDAIFAGQMISTTALAAIGQIFPIYFIIIAMGVGLSIGTTSLIANNIGKNNLKDATNIFAQGIFISLLLSIIISFLGINYSEIIISSINSDLETLIYSSKYLNIIFLGSVFIFILMIVNSCLSAQGDTASYRNVLIFSFFLNIILNPILISGKLFSIELFTPLGISGIAIATIISQFIGVFYLIYKLQKTFIFKIFKLSLLKPKINFIKNILTQGIPASIGLMMIAVGSYILLYFVALFGNEAIAGYSAAIRFEQLFFLPLLGLNTAIISIVGQNFGAKNYKRIIEAYDKGLKVGIIILILLGIIIFIISEIAIKFFTDNNEVIKYGSLYLKISAFMFPAFPFFFIGNATFQGLKRAIIVMYMSILRFVIIPLIFLIMILKIFEINYTYMFISLATVHWIVGIMYYFFSKYKINKILE